MQEALGLFRIDFNARRGGLIRERDDHFPGARVVEFFACLVLNGAGVILQPFHVSLQPLIFLLQPLQLLLQDAGVMALLFVSRDAVLAENDMEAHADGKRRGGNRRAAPPLFVDPMQPAADAGQRHFGRTRWNSPRHISFSSTAHASAVKWISPGIAGRT